MTLRCPPARLIRLLAVVLLAALGPASAAEDRAPATALTGRMLIAEPGMEGSYFAQTVIYMVRHGPSGAFGLVVNRPFGPMAFDDLAERLALAEPPESGELILHSGGPVEPTAMFVLHSSDVLAKSSTRLEDDLALTSDPEILGRIVAGDGPARFRVVLGYAGWAPGQLENELDRGSWDVIDYDAGLVFGTTAGAWQRARSQRAFDL